MIKAIIFDIGGVNIYDNPMPFFSKLEKSFGVSKEKIYKYTFDTKEWQEPYNRGLISEKELWKRLESKGNLKREVLNDIKKSWRSFLKPIPETIKIIKHLKGKYKVYALSNVDKGTVLYMKKQYGIYKIFDDTVLSCDVGMVKPHAGIYKFTLKKFKLNADECIFIDNRPKNVKGAEKVGIKSILFKSPEQLKKDLRKLGIFV